MKKEKLMEIITGLGVLLSIAGGACAVIVPLLFLIGFGIFFYRRYQQGNTLRASAQSWSSTSGVVLSSSVKVRHSGRSRSDYPAVVYQYEVNGKSYQSQRIKAGDKFMSVRIIGEAQATVARYPAGSRVTVFYDPNNPSESALER
ncbi:MAG: hypothetical protein HFACDABA_00585 [Anaerolineales bacterium]|nr:hypothetical protein [Anaerolineales bacterium]